MPNWTFVLADHAGNEIAEIVTARGKTLTFKRNTYGEVSFAFSHEDDVAALLLAEHANAGIPKLHCYRDGVLRFNGYLAPFEEEADLVSTLTPVFRGPFAQLLGDGPDRGRFTDEFVPYIDDAGNIAFALLAATNTDSPTGLVAGTVEATTTRERTFEYANVGSSIVDLSALSGGFDFMERYVNEGTTLAHLDIVASQGVAQPSSKFEYGPDTLANVSNVKRQTQPPANYVRAIGSDGLVGIAQDATSIATYKKWPMQVQATDIDDQSVLDAKAQGLLRPAPVRTVSFTPVAGSAPAPWDDYWLGDTVPLYARRDAFTLDVSVRVNGIVVVIDEEGNEATEVQDPTTPDEEATLKASLTVEVVN